MESTVQSPIYIKHHKYVIVLNQQQWLTWEQTKRMMKQIVSNHPLFPASVIHNCWYCFRHEQSGCIFSSHILLATNTFIFSEVQQEKNYIRILLQMIHVSNGQILTLFGIIMSLENNTNKIQDTNKDSNIFIPSECKASIITMTVDMFRG